MERGPATRRISNTIPRRSVTPPASGPGRAFAAGVADAGGAAMGRPGAGGPGAGGTGPDGTGPDGTGPDGTGPDGTGPGRAGPGGAWAEADPGADHQMVLPGR